MSYHNAQLGLDIFQVFKLEVDPCVGILLDDLVTKVQRLGQRQQRIFTDDEIIDEVSSLVDTGLVTKDGNRYKWFR